MLISNSVQNHGDDSKPGALGWLALVCYLPDRQKAFLEPIRQRIGGRALPPFHITILPPRPLGSSLDQACAQIAAATGSRKAFSAELSEVRYFPETEFLYMDIAAGRVQLYELHKVLNAGELAYREVHEFRPHLTLGGPVLPEHIKDAQQRTAEEWARSECPRPVLIEELVCLWLAPGSENKEWQRYRSFSLSSSGAKSLSAGAAGADPIP